MFNWLSYFRTTFYTVCEDYYWLGFNDTYGTGDYKWIHGNQTMNLSWASSYPICNNGLCGAFRGWWYKTVLNDNCNTAYKYICQLRFGMPQRIKSSYRPYKDFSDLDSGCNANIVIPSYCPTTSTSTTTVTSTSITTKTALSTIKAIVHVI